MKKLLLFLVLILSCVVLISRFGRVLASGSLLTYWAMDETTAGSTVTDSSGNGYNGTPHNSPTPSTDIPSTISFSDPRSLKFDGSQWVSIPDNAAFAMTDATFSVWVKFTDTSQGDMNMIAKRSSDGSQVQWQFGYNGSGNQFKVSLANGGNSCCTDFDWSPSPSLTQNVWYNIAVSINSTTHKLRWYQNGTFKTEDDITGHNLGTQVAGTDLTLGASYDGTAERLFGLLDDVRIYNTALSDSDIADIAAGDLGPGVSSPTPSPTSTPATQTSTPLSNSSGNPYACTSSAPTSSPNLFQIDTAGTYANLYFTTVKNTTGYRIDYGLNPHTNQYGDSWSYTGPEWVLGRTIQHLTPNTTYYFKVQAANGCNGGAWSKVVQVKTKSKFADIAQWFANLNPF